MSNNANFVTFLSWQICGANDTKLKRVQRLLVNLYPRAPGRSGISPVEPVWPNVLPYVTLVPCLLSLQTSSI